MSDLNPRPVPTTIVDPNLAAGAALPAGAAPQPDETPHRPPDDVEEVYYEGSPLLRGAIGKGVLWVLLGILLIAVAVAAAILHWKFPWWLELAIGVIGLVLILVPVIQTRAVRYRISNYRVDYERGLLSRDIDTLELWHIEDIRFHQSLIDRILGVGDITVVSHDQTMPSLTMHSIPHPRPLYEQLKQRVIAVKRQRGVIKMDPG